ncbi:hypothetical protein LOZ61_001178 [Ophidiomyces ophidiicola]|nr:hypothetical protein LOZ61_001178 [Ophidiomyces ophidiicola]KAI1929455.1 hypothetical protein LOZ60_001669 [Ophidiomyces ophidiicola]KAI2144712.1 hypothetical protein LOZ27_003548 [Ophidiomyces ophidiicola]KAI2419196.1 hypothetical protein LOY90_000334 [Ophidiomyces ophidiicola]
MPSLLSIAAVLISAASLVAAVPTEKVPRIVGGSPAPAEHAKIVLSSSNNGQKGCQAVLIGPKTAISPRNCFLTPLSNYTLRTGSLKWNSGGTILEIESQVLHPEPPGLEGNIAVLRLKTTIEGKGIVYGKLPAQDADPAPGTRLMVSGWGETTPGGSPSSTLRTLQASTLAHQDCGNKWMGKRIVYSDDLCASGASGKYASDGDRGSPLFDPSTGIVYGFLIRSGLGEHPDLYTDIARLSDWIKSHMA